MDLAQGLVFNSNGTLTPFSTVDGAKCLHFNNSGYWVSGYENVDMGGPCTLILWVYSEGIGERDVIFEKAGTTYNSYQQEIAVTWETDQTLTYYSRRATYDYGETSAIPLGQWTMMALKMSTAKDSGVARTGHYSKNGAPWTSDYTSRSVATVTAAGAIKIGNGYAGVMEDGFIGKVLTYDRELTDAEILQNFIADRRRFQL
jgi:hypothetical protein